MKFVQNTSGKPYKIKRFKTVHEFEWLPNGDLVVIETNKRKVFLSKIEAIKVKKQIDEKIGYHKYEISEDYKKKVQEDIDILQEASDDWNKALNDHFKKQQEDPVEE